MSTSDELEIAIQKTQRVLSKVISKPNCTQKLLSKPPFRFIHDIVTSTLKSTGFPNRYFTTQELDSRNFNDKNSKTSFLDKLIYLVSAAKGFPLDVRPSKIVAGLEPINTNILLTGFGSIASDKSLDKDAVIKHCLNGGQIGGLPWNLETKKQQILETSTLDSNDCETSPDSAAEESIRRDLIPKGESDINNGSDIQITQTILHSLISKPKCSEKLLGKPPFRFIHDVVMAVNKAASMGIEKVLR
jgi:hypothetical protein